MDKKKKKNPSPRESANFVSKFVFWWLKSLLGRLRDAEDVGGAAAEKTSSEFSYDVRSSDRSELLGDRLEAKWKQVVAEASKAEGEERPRLWKAILRAFKWYFVQHVLVLVALELVLSIAQPLIVSSIIQHFDTFPQTKPAGAYARATSYALTLALQALLAPHARFQQLENGARLRAACASLIYKKITRLSCSSTSQATKKMIIDLLENDIANFDRFFYNIHYIWITPLQTAMIIYLMCKSIGGSCLTAVFLILIQGFPIRVYCNKIALNLHSKVTAWTSERVTLMTEVVRKIRETKIYCWEQQIEKIIFLNRRYEVDILKIASYIKGLDSALRVFGEHTSLLSTIFFYVMWHNALEAHRIFLVVLYLFALYESLNFVFPKAVASALRANVSVRRIEEFLLLDEVEPNIALSMLSSDDSSIIVKDVNASWTKGAIVSLLENIDVCVPPTKLFAVVGPTGAGKSSFLKLILGELRPSSGDVSVNGSLSYASQQPWLCPGTLRDNVLCSEVYDEVQYRHLVEICGLVPVFERLPQGDETLLLKNGRIELDAEERAKINLARALYKDADIYLLDDLFTLLGNKIYEDCIHGLLKDKTRIVVLNQGSQHLQEVDEIILFDHGQIDFQGSFSSFEKSGKFFDPPSDVTEIPPVEETDANEGGKLTLSASYQPKKSEEKEPEETEELLTKASASECLYWKYLRAGGSYCALGALFLLFVSAQVSISGTDYWLAYWTNQEESRRNDYKSNLTNFFMVDEDRENSTSTEEPDKSRYFDTETSLYTYASLILGTIVLSIIRNLLFLRICLDGSKNTHNTMVYRLLRAPMRFFYGNPSRSILHRFSKDITQIDKILPEAMLDVSQMFSAAIGATLILVVINYWTTVPIYVAVFLYLYLNRIYASTIPKLKLLEYNAGRRSLYHVESSLLGLPTIRNSRAQRLVLRGFTSSQDARTSARSLVLACSAGFRFWLDVLLALLGSLIVFALMALQGRGNVLAACVGLAVKEFSMMTRLARLGMKASAKAVDQRPRLERTIRYTELEQEASFDGKVDKEQLKGWPSKGEIKFDHLYVRYSESDEPVLANLDFTIEAGSKVLVIENGDWPKASLTAALYRLADVTEGSLLVDGVDCALQSLGDVRRLRRAVAYVSREAVFPAEGSSPRDNLDPGHEFEDAALWRALETVELKRAFASLEHSCAHLSPGSRKLLSLARAVLRGSKILVVDEGAASDDEHEDAALDDGTEETLDRLLRTELEGCTVVRISRAGSRVAENSHSDKVVAVSEDGEATEYNERRGDASPPQQLDDGLITDAALIHDDITDEKTE